MDLTNFQKVRVFNRAFDVMPKSQDIIARINIFTEDPKAVKLRLDLIREEINELKDAFEMKDIIEVRDAIADILYVVYGMADVFGIDIDNNIRMSYKIVNSSITNFEIIKSHNTNETLTDTPEVLISNILYFYHTLEGECINQQFNNVSEYIQKLLEKVYLLAQVLEINADKDFDIVHSSNMSKLCSNEEEARLTVDDYKNKFKSGLSLYDSPYYYNIPDLNKWIVKNRSSGKVLKNINYVKVSF